MNETTIEPQGNGSRWLHWGLLAALGLYTILIFYGVGPPAEGIAQHWYEPRAFLFDVPGIASLFEGVWSAIATTTLPALILAVLVFRSGGSAWARALALSCVVAAPLFAFYGVQARFVWEFFGWRGSAVLWLLSFTVGMSLAAPFLARSWLRLGWPLRAAVYLPFVFVVIAFMRNATGTDESLRFAISPWPVVPVFGIEAGSLFIMACLVGVAIGVTAIARRRAAAGDSVGRMIGGVVLGIAAPALLLLLGSQLDMLAFGVGIRTVVVVSVLCAVTIAVAGTLPLRGGAEALRSRARGITAGAALLGIPLVAGQAIARYDYYVTREHDARSIIEALASYVETEEIYPDDLEVLVASNHLESVPSPSIGFGFLYDGEFRYQSFGTSFLLEFPAPRWVECAYTPPYDDEDYDEEGYEDEGGAEPDTGDGDGDGVGLDEAWSCPSKPPELW